MHLAPEGRHVYSRAIGPSFQAPEGRHVLSLQRSDMSIEYRCVQSLAPAPVLNPDVSGRSAMCIAEMSL